MHNYALFPITFRLIDKRKKKKQNLELKKKEIEDSLSFIDWKQNFYDDVLTGKTEYYSYLIDKNNSK